MYQENQSDCSNGREVEQWPCAEASETCVTQPDVVIGACYARYSTDHQKMTSIDDQIRACMELAARHGIVIPPEFIFVDEAITGGKSGTHKREQYHALRDAVKAGKIQVLLCDQQCRLARHAKEALDFFDDLKTHHVRLLTADGMDSESATGALLFGVKSVFAEFFLDETRHRITRSLRGGFARGSMVTAVPYGYVVDHEASAASAMCVWQKDPEAAAVVQEVFDLRSRGMSSNQIAAILNMRDIPTPRESNEEGNRLYWRAAGVWRILRNPIYKGTYQVNFGGKQSSDAVVDQRIIPELAMVSAEVWATCQETSHGASRGGGRRRATHGGGKHPLAGVIRCGVCGVPLSCHHAKNGGGSMHCIQCEHATAVGVPGRKPLYVSVKGIREMLRFLIMRVVQGPALESYRTQLQKRLEGGRGHALADARNDLQRMERKQGWIARLMKDIDAEDPVLERQYVEVREEVLRHRNRVASLERDEQALNLDSLQRQLAVDLSVVTDAFLSDDQQPEKTRVLLNRVFPSIVLHGKTDRYTAIFSIKVKAGALLAVAADAIELDAPDDEIWLQLNTSSSKSPVWTVEEIDAPDSAQRERS